MLAPWMKSYDQSRQCIKKQRHYFGNKFSSVQLLSHVWLCDPMDCSTTGFPVHQQLQELTHSMSIESMMPSNHLILCRPLLLQSFPASGSFQMSQFLTSGGQSIGVSALASVLPLNIEDWFPLGLTGWISL